MDPHKKSNATEKRHGSQSVEKQNKGSGREPSKCQTCCGDHCKKDCPMYQVGRPQIYSSQESQTIGDVSQSIPWIYAAVDNRQVEHQSSIIEMEGKLHDQVVYILIDIGSNYSYISPDLVDKCFLCK